MEERLLHAYHFFRLIIEDTSKLALILEVVSDFSSLMIRKSTMVNGIIFTSSAMVTMLPWCWTRKTVYERTHVHLVSVPKSILMGVVFKLVPVYLMMVNRL